jgi:hypothetical protein
MVTQFVAGIDLPKLHRSFKFHRRAALADEGSTHVLALEGDDLRKLPLHGY